MMQPVGWPDRITLFLDGAPFPLPSDQAAAVADSLSALTPGYTWRFMLQQPAYEGQQPEVPAMDAAPSPAPAPASSAAAAAAAPAPAPSVALLAPAPGPSPAGLEAADLAQRVSVDPLPQNNLGGRRRLRQAGSPPDAATADASAAAAGAPGELPFAEKGQCYSVKHVLAPDEAACVAYCDGQVAAGKVDPTELNARFYDCKAEGGCPTGETPAGPRGRACRGVSVLGMWGGVGGWGRTTAFLGLCCSPPSPIPRQHGCRHRLLTTTKLARTALQALAAAAAPPTRSPARRQQTQPLRQLPPRRPPMAPPLAPPQPQAPRLQGPLPRQPSPGWCCPPRPPRPRRRPPRLPGPSACFTLHPPLCTTAALRWR